MKIFFHISHLFGKAEKSFLVLNLKLHLKLSFQVFSHLPTSRVLNYWWVILYDSLCWIWWEHYPQLGMVILNKWPDFESFWYKISIELFFKFQNDQKIHFFIKTILLSASLRWSQGQVENGSKIFKITKSHRFNFPIGLARPPYGPYRPPLVLSPAI